MNENLTITLDESQRQFVVLALAHLAIERPGWDMMISQVVAKMDNKLPNGRLHIYEEFKRTHDPRRINPPGDPTLPRAENTDQYTIAVDGSFIICKKCHLPSWNLNDVRERYCGFCKAFHDRP